MEHIESTESAKMVGERRLTPREADPPSALVCGAVFGLFFG